MRGRFSLLVLVLFLFGSACATINARRSFTAAEKARKAGDYDAAIRGYQDAADADPKKEEYRKALEATRKEAAETRATAALDAEKRGDFQAAANLWAEAQKIDPANSEYAARIEIARLKTKRADPVEYYEAAKKLVAALPEDAEAKKSLAEAKREALAYHLRLADTYTEAKAWDKALEELEIAKKIDPENQVFRGTAYRTAEARRLEASGDERMKAGDSLGAFQAYERAASLTNDRNLETKMNRARRGAGSTIEQLDQARTFEQLGKWEDAAELYTVLSQRANAPADVSSRTVKARKESARLRADRAKSFAERNLPQKAVAELMLALEHTDAEKNVLALLNSAADDLQANNPGSAIQKIQAASTADPTLPAAMVASEVALCSARAAYEEAQRIADQRPAEAMLAVSRLEPFSAKLKGHAAFRDKLVKRAFGALVAEAERASDAGRYEQAAEMLQAALQVSKPPAAMADHLQRGSSALAKKDYDEARVAFDDALKVSAKSNLAKAGRKVAIAARLVELKAEAKDARAGEDNVRAASSYRAILELDPSDIDARQGTSELRGALVDTAVKAAKEHSASGRSGAAFVYYRRVLDLDPEHAEAKAAVAAIGKQLAPESSEPEAYVAAVEAAETVKTACPQIYAGLRDRLALYLTKTPKLGARYLEHDQVKAIEEKKRPQPPVALRVTIDSCTLAATGGTTSVKAATALAGAVLAEDQIDSRFDPSKLPRDEQDGLDQKRMEKALLAETANTIAARVKNHAAKLSDWRTSEAEAAVRSNDAEAAARIFAQLSTQSSLSEGERRALRDLERYLINKYR
jgi:tetratricopeptide (TPR) repeat protein